MQGSASAWLTGTIQSDYKRNSPDEESFSELMDRVCRSSRVFLLNALAIKKESPPLLKLRRANVEMPGTELKPETPANIDVLFLHKLKAPELPPRKQAFFYFNLLSRAF